MKAPNRLQRWLEWIGWPHSQGSVETGAVRLPLYTEYRLTLKEFWISTAVGCAVSFTAAWLVYRSIAAALLLSVFGIAAPRFHRRSLLERRRSRLTLQFKEALYSLSSSLAAGRSVENAFVSALDDLRLLYPDPRTEVLEEFEIIKARLAYGEPLEHALLDFSRRARIDDVGQFCDVFTVCKRSGGDLVEVIRRTSQTIGEKLDVQQEIAVMVARKRYEARIMMAVPFVFLAFLGFAAPDYMAPLYSSALGYALLTASLLLLGVSYWFMAKIMNIRV